MCVCFALRRIAVGAWQEYYNDDARYKLAYEELTELKELAEGVVDVWLSDGVRTAAGASWLTLKGAKQTRIRLTHEELAWCKQEPLLGKAGRAAGLALKLCKMKRLLAVEIEERDSAGFSPLMRWANDGYPLAVSLLLDAGADRAAATSSGEVQCCRLRYPAPAPASCWTIPNEMHRSILFLPACLWPDKPLLPRLPFISPSEPSTLRLRKTWPNTGRQQQRKTR